MPDEPNALREGHQDEALNQIREGLTDLDALKKEETPAEPEPEPETKEEETAEAEAKPQEPEGPTLEEALAENAQLKQKLGTQGNQVGSLRERLAEVGGLLDERAAAPAAPPDPTHNSYR